MSRARSQLERLRFLGGEAGRPSDASLAMMLLNLSEGVDPASAEHDELAAYVLQVAVRLDPELGLNS